MNIAQVFIEDRRVQAQQVVGIARLDQGAVKLPVVTLPEFLLCLIPSQHLLFNFMKLVMGGNKITLPISCSVRHLVDRI